MYRNSERCRNRNTYAFTAKDMIVNTMSIHSIAWRNNVKLRVTPQSHHSLETSSWGFLSNRVKLEAKKFL